MNVRFHLNGEEVETAVSPQESALVVLRRLGAGSVRETCALGVCGACTALLDGEPVASCLLFAPLLADRAVTTAEGLPADDPVIRAFVETHAFQCGFCTPGFALAVRDLIATSPEPSDAELTAALSGNLCRCGSYLKIAEAARLAARYARDEGQKEAGTE